MLLEVLAGMAVAVSGGSAGLIACREWLASRQARICARTDTDKLYIMVRELDTKRHLTPREKGLFRAAKREIEKRIDDDGEPYTPPSPES